MARLTADHSQHSQNMGAAAGLALGLAVGLMFGSTLPGIGGLVWGTILCASFGVIIGSMVGLRGDW